MIDPVIRKRRPGACLGLLALSLYSLCALYAPALRADAVIDGKQVYEKSCSKCHSSAIGAFFSGAPRLGDASWKTRLAAAGSLDKLAADASMGIGKMPPQGGAGGLSDSEVRAAVAYILEQSAR